MQRETVGVGKGGGFMIKGADEIKNENQLLTGKRKVNSLTSVRVLL